MLVPPASRPGAALLQQWPSIVLVVIGTGMIVAGIVQGQARAAEAIALFAFGAGLVGLGAAFPRVTRAKVGTEGFELDLSARKETSALLSQSPDRASGLAVLDDDDIVAASRSLLAQNSLLAHLRAEDGPLTGCRLELYLYDADSGLLEPTEVAGRPQPPDAWPPGQGATGTAWERGEFVLVEGDAAFDETLGLTPAQQERFQDLTAVAAMPVLNARDQVIAVLTASTKDAAHELASQPAFDDLIVRSQVIARVLVDVLKWFDDGYSVS